MKRRIVEIGSGVALFAVVATLQAQLVDLRQRQQVTARAGTAWDPLGERELERTRAELSRLQQDYQHALDERLERVEERVDAATRSAEDARELESELEAARREARSFQTTIARDVDATRSLVQSYEAALRETDARTREAAEQSRTVLEQLHGRAEPDADVLTRELLLPTVQLEGRDTVGSGTLVRSARNAATGEVENYVLTAYHVVRNIFTDTPTAKRDGMSIKMYLPGGERLTVRGDLVASERSIDVALVRLQTDRVFDTVARVVPRDRATGIAVWDGVFAIGCPLGNDPIPTRGVITSTRNVINGSNYWMLNAPTYYGNSGGGIFLAETRELAGVFSKIYTHGHGVPVVVPHMGLCTPMATVYEWLDREGLAAVLPDDPSAAPPIAERVDLASPPR
ncbi:MAG: trypsin-like peptidase domain-containing protein [Planctomycetes bacterium]|nr:trypsin-like peptidase domain-containing protein [Planctomycetota bacterium]